MTAEAAKLSPAGKFSGSGGPEVTDQAFQKMRSCGSERPDRAQSRSKRETGPRILLLAVVLFAGGASAQTPSNQQIAERVEGYLKPFVDSGNFSGSILIARHGQVVLRRGYGMANYELMVPNSPATRFHIASISKPFTAAAILQLEESGRLATSDSVARFVPDFPNGDRITLQHLLTHTSGIPEINDLHDYDTFALSPHTAAQLVAKFAGLPLEFQPGSKQEYSNSNYELLALVIEKVSGESYGEYLRKHILAPAGMNDSGHDGDASQLIPNAASGYRPAGLRDYEKAPYLDWSNKTGSGSITSTVEDLYRFDRALRTGAVLKAASLRKYSVECEENCYGWYWDTISGHRAMFGRGRGPGFTAELDRFYDDDITVIVLSNGYSTGAQNPIARALCAIALGQEPPQPPAVRALTLPQAELAAEAGDYQYGPEFFTPYEKFTLKAQPGYLLMERGSFRAPLVPVSPNQFLERIFFGKVTFSRDAGGKVTGCTVRYGNKDFPARRLEGGPRPQ